MVLKGCAVMEVPFIFRHDKFSLESISRKAVKFGPHFCTSEKCSGSEDQWLLPTSGAYRLFTWYIEQDVSPDHVLFVQNKQAVSPQSGHQPQKKMIDRQHTRDQRLLTALIGFRPGDPIRSSINGVLSEKHVQLGRMFLHVAHVVQEEL